MSRPPIDYYTEITAPSSYTWFDINGKVVGSGTVTASIESRRCTKPRSIKTTPRSGGQYSSPTPYSMVYGHWSCSSSMTCYTWNRVPPLPYRLECSGSPYGSIGFDPSSLYLPPSWVENMLLIRALNKLRDQNVNFGVMLAEAHQTANLLSGSAIQIASSVASFVKRRPRDFARAVRHQGTKSWKKTPRAWLELQYGWNPLMADINGACVELDSNRVRERNYISVSAKKSLRDTVSYTPSVVAAAGAVRCIVGVEADFAVRLCYRLRNFTLALFSSLGLTNPAEIIWEKVPYSFVVDWFLPVGNWLSALGGDFGFDFVNGSYSKFRRLTNVRTEGRTYPDIKEGYYPQINGYGIAFDRTVYQSSPWPGLYFKSPVSPTHIANAMSLLSQAFRRH